MYLTDYLWIKVKTMSRRRFEQMLGTTSNKNFKWHETINNNTNTQKPNKERPKTGNSCQINRSIHFISFSSWKVSFKNQQLPAVTRVRVIQALIITNNVCWKFFRLSFSSIWCSQSHSNHTLNGTYGQKNELKQNKWTNKGNTQTFHKDCDNYHSTTDKMPFQP